jgi:hypothetical protein
MSKLFDKLKTASTRLSQGSVSALTNTWQDYAEKLSAKGVDLAKDVAKQGKSVMLNDVEFKKCVNDTLWELLPMPIRLIGRERLKYDSIIFSLRDKVFVLEGDSVQVRPDAKAKIMEVIKPIFDHKL